MGPDRMRQVNKLIHHAVNEIIVREIEMPLDVFITITRVETARDLKNVNIWLTILPDHKRVSTIKLLSRRLSLIQKLLGQRIKLKYTPKILFCFDEGEIKAQQINKLLDG